ARLKKVMADRRASLDDQRDVRPACLKLVKEVFEQGASLPIVPFPEDAASIQDTPRLALVLTDPAAEWDRNGKIRQQIAEWTLRRGSSARLYPASLIWCLRKSGRDLADRVETWLAWQRVQRDLAEGVLGHDRSRRATRGADPSEGSRQCRQGRRLGRLPLHRVHRQRGAGSPSRHRLGSRSQ